MNGQPPKTDSQRDQGPPPARGRTIRVPIAVGLAANDNQGPHVTVRFRASEVPTTDEIEVLDALLSDFTLNPANDNEPWKVR
jgi:hypothetical protein